MTAPQSCPDPLAELTSAPQPPGLGRGRLPLTVNLTAVWPDLPATLPEADRPLAERLLVVQRLDAVDTDLDQMIERSSETFGFAVTAGAVLKETTLMGRAALELLGPGDVLVPPLSSVRQLDTQAISRYLAHGPASFAALDGTFRQAARRWPQLADLLHDRLAQQTHRASANLAMVHLPRAEDRLLALFSDLAARYGQVRGSAVHLDLPVTHDVIGGLIGSRRPTVSLALRVIADQVVRLDDGTWEIDLALVVP